MCPNLGRISAYESEKSVPKGSNSFGYAPVIPHPMDAGKRRCAFCKDSICTTASNSDKKQDRSSEDNLSSVIPCLEHGLTALRLLCYYNTIAVDVCQSLLVILLGF